MEDSPRPDTLPRVKVFVVDSYGRAWEYAIGEFCPVCGQPDNCGDCQHGPLSEEQARLLGAYISSEES